MRLILLRGAAALLALTVPWTARGARLLSASTCLQASGNRCAQTTDQIPWESPEVHALVVVGEARPGTRVKAVWVSVDAIEPRNFVIQTEERKVDAAGSEVPLLFSIAKDEWPAGQYRIDLSVDGKAERSLPFSVRKASAGGRTAGTPVARWSPRETPAPAATPPAPPSPGVSARTAPVSSTPDLRAPSPASASPPASAPSAAPSTAPSAASPLTGSWVAQGPFGPLTLEFPSPGTLVLGGQAYSYTAVPNALRVLEEGVLTDYPYSLRGGVLTLLFPQGFSLAFQPAAFSPAASAYGSAPYAGGVAQAPPAESHLWGFLCTGALQVGPGVTAIQWSEFSGTGEFTFGQDAGLPYGRVTQGGGTYTVVGETVQFLFADGTLGAAQVVARQPDGRIVSLAYGQVLYASGLCP